VAYLKEMSRNFPAGNEENPERIKTADVEAED
jgi:hypothetical protein